MVDVHVRQMRQATVSKFLDCSSKFIIRETVTRTLIKECLGFRLPDKLLKNGSSDLDLARIRNQGGAAFERQFLIIVDQHLIIVI